MSSSLMSDGCVNYEKCGEVIVSPKNNTIKMYCIFCCEIHDNLLEFLHHLHSMHNNVLGFTKPLNVYNIEELLSQAEELECVESQADSSTSSDSGIPSNTSGEIELETKTCIFNGATVFDAKETMKSDVIEEVEALLFEDKENVETSQPDGEDIKIQIEDTTDHCLELQQLLQDAGLHSIQVNEEQPQSMTTSDTQLKKRITAKQQKEEHNSMQSKMQTEKPRSTCDLKSYAIARSARQREQNQRMRNIKRRIFRSLENEPDFIIPKMQIEPKLKPSTALKAVVEAIDAKQNLNDETNSIMKRYPRSPLIINKIEILPRLNLPFKNTKNNVEEKIARRRSSLTVVNSPPMVSKNSRRPSISAYTTPKCDQLIVQGKSISLETKPCQKQNNKRKQVTANISNCAFESAIETKRTKTDSKPTGSPNFNLSESVLALLKSEWDTTLDADSLLELAKPWKTDSFDTTLNQDEGEIKVLQQNSAPIAPANAVEVNVGPKDVLRSNLSLLKVVGLPIIMDPYCEDHKPVEFSETLRKKAAKFSKMIYSCSAVWYCKRFDTQGNQKTLKALSMLTEEANCEFKENLSVSELKRILSLINVWYVHKNYLKVFKKAKLSTTINHYMQLFAFLPKWQVLRESNQSSYENHRQSHLGA